MNPIPVVTTTTKTMPTTQSMLKQISDTGKAINAVNPMHYAYQASETVNKSTQVEGTVSYINVIHWITSIVSLIFWASSWLISGVIWLLYMIISTLITLCIFITPFLPIFIVFILIGFVCQSLWDVVVAPIIEGLVDAYNGVIYQWNKITDAVRHIGFHVPLRILGKDVGFDVNLGGIDLPYGTEASVNIVSFRDFIVDILYMMIVEPILLLTNGYIFRSNGLDFSLNDLNQSIDQT